MARDKDDEDDNGHDNLVMDSVVEVIGALAKAIGPAFAPYFEPFRLPLLKFTKSGRSYSDKAMAIGCFAEVIDEMGSIDPGSAQWVLPLFCGGLEDEMESVRRNSAFGLGAFCAAVGPAAAAHYPMILQSLRPLCVRSQSQAASDAGGADIDNAIAAVARMIKLCPGAVPLPQVLPVFLGALPLRSDMLETTNVYGCLVFLLQSEEPTAVSLFPQILNIFAHVLSETSKTLPEAKALITSCLKAMSTDSRYQSLLANSFRSLENESLRMNIDLAMRQP